jgi:hypothetical protein
MSRAAYIHNLLTLYCGLPEGARRRPSPADRELAGQLFDLGIAMTTVQSAVLLALARRGARPNILPALPPIRSLAYFRPIIEELHQSPLPPGYLGYLLRRRFGRQISTDWDPR